MPETIPFEEPLPAETAPFVDDEAWAMETTTPDECEIAYWRGYRKAAFYARVFDETGLELALAESGYFRATGNGIPDPSEAALQAHAALIASLEAQGWRLVADDGPSAWFARRLRLVD